MKVRDYPTTYKLMTAGSPTATRCKYRQCGRCGTAFNNGEKIIVVEVRHGFMRGDDEYVPLCSEECRKSSYPGAKKEK